MGRKHEETLSLVREAIDQLKRGDIVDALTTLERCAFPKWESVEDSQIDYLMAVTPDANLGLISAGVYFPSEEQEAALSGAVE